MNDPAWPCDVRFETPFGKSKCVSCGREWEAMTPQGSERHCVRELGSRLAAANIHIVELRKKVEDMDCRRAVAVHRAEQAEALAATLDARIVRGCFVEEFPSFQQGPPDHEVLADVTAADCEGWCERIRQLETIQRDFHNIDDIVKIRELEKEVEKWKAQQKNSD
jgi:hypothetical protein